MESVANERPRFLGCAWKFPSDAVQAAGNIRTPAEAFKSGNTVRAAAIEVEAASRKLRLSVTDCFKNKEDSEWKSYPAAHKLNQRTLGDGMPKMD
jgi:hypothetical protein